MNLIWILFCCFISIIIILLLRGWIISLSVCLFFPFLLAILLCNNICSFLLINRDNWEFDPKLLAVVKCSKVFLPRASSSYRTSNDSMPPQLSWTFLSILSDLNSADSVSSSTDLHLSKSFFQIHLGLFQVLWLWLA